MVSGGVAADLLLEPLDALVLAVEEQLHSHQTSKTPSAEVPPSETPRPSSCAHWLVAA